nr:MAG TPA: hypothetical protein [Caudoviricetes sp.]
MKKTILMYESDKENHICTIKAEGELLELIAGAGAILKAVSKAAAKALGEEPEDMAIRIAGATIDMLMDEKKGEANE